MELHTLLSIQKTYVNFAMGTQCLPKICLMHFKLHLQEKLKNISDICQTKFSKIFQDGLECCTKVKATIKLKTNTKTLFRPK